MNNIYFTSDSHFGHSNIIKLSNRPFHDIHEMNEELIKRWNRKVRPNDDVYHLGDFALTKDKYEVSKIIDRLNGNIYLIEGNHEGPALASKHKFKWVKQYHEIKVKDPDSPNGSQLIVLFHSAMRVWRNDFRGSWHLYGHTHGTLPDKLHKLAIDVGVDCHEFTPLSYAEVKAIMAEKEWRNPFEDR